METRPNIVDDKGTDQARAQEILRTFRDAGFEGDDERAGLVLGRQPEEIRDMLDGDLDIDDDLTMKIRGIARERGIDLQ